MKSKKLSLAKRFTAILLSGLMLFSLAWIPIEGSAEEISQNISGEVEIQQSSGVNDEFEYFVYEDGTFITKYNGNDVEVTVPGYIDGHAINGISKDVFKNKDWIEKVIISSPIEYIDSFSGCTSLEYVIFPDTLTQIGDNAFSNCTSLKSVTFPNSLTKLGSYTFQNCTSLKDVIIPDSVTSLGEDVFANCINMSSITIPKSVKYINAYTFEAEHPVYGGYRGGKIWTYYPFYIFCYAGTYAQDFADKNGVQYKLIDADDFATVSEDDFGYITMKNDTICITEYKGKATTVDIPRKIGGKIVSAIGNKCFWKNSSIKKVIIPSSVTLIGNAAFMDCENLQDIVIPSGVADIPENCFFYCSSLKNVVLSEGVTNIKAGSFRGCKSLKSITLPNSLEEIGEYAFAKTSLTEILIPKNVKSINHYAFDYCDNFSEIKLNSKNTNFHLFDGILFDSNKYLVVFPFAHSKTITIPGDILLGGIEGQYWYYDNGNFGYKFYNPDDNDYYCEIENVIIEDGVEIIGTGAFNGCWYLRSVSIPNSVKIIDPTAFSGCKSLKSINIPKTVEYIDDFAFYGCTSLDSVTIPYSIKEIGYGAFEGCSKLTSVEFPDKEDYYIENDAFRGCNNLTISCYKCSKADKYALDNSLNVKYLGHSSFSSSTVDKAKAPTCTKTGLTEGKHCSVCGEVIVEQESVPIFYHNFVDGVCTVCGTIDTSYCKPSETDTDTDIQQSSDSDTDSDTKKDTDSDKSSDTKKDSDIDKEPDKNPTNPDKPKDPIETGTMGDLDGDGKITSADSLLILRQSVGLEQFTDFQKKLADVDGDGNITSADALEVLRYSVNLPTKGNIGEIFNQY